MNQQQFEQQYLEAVHKCALGIKIIRQKGPDFGLDDETMELNEKTLVGALSKGVGISFMSVQNDVYDQVQHFPDSFFRRNDVRRLMNTMIPQMKVAGLLN